MYVRYFRGMLELSALRQENDQLKSRVEEGRKAANKVRKLDLPRTVKPGKKDTRTPLQRNLASARQRLSKTGKVRDAAALIEQTLEDF